MAHPGPGPSFGGYTPRVLRISPPGGAWKPLQLECLEASFRLTNNTPGGAWKPLQLECLEASFRLTNNTSSAGRIPRSSNPGDEVSQLPEMRGS
jgi:hypothetical protein